MEIKHTLCPSCSVGCGINVVSKDSEVVGTFPYKRHPINEGKNCLNGRTSIEKLENRTKTEDIEAKLDEAAELLKADNVAVVVSGNNTNEEIEAIKKFAEAGNYTVGFYADNFPNYDGELATYDEIDDANSILAIGDIIYENPLVGRRVFHAIDNGADLIAIGNADRTVTSINASEYIQADSVSDVINGAVGALHDEAIIIVNDINDFEEFELILEKAGEVNAKVLPLFSQPNTKGAMNVFEAGSRDDVEELIRSSDVVVSFKDDVFDYADGAKVITFSPYENDVTAVADVVIPVKAWVEIDGSFTNAMGTTQNFEVSAHSDEGLSEVDAIDKIMEKL